MTSARGSSVDRGSSGRAPATYPTAAAAWPAVGFFVFFVWLELAYLRADMGLVVLGYTILTLAGMAVFGRDTWRDHVEVFSVWFGLLGRLAALRPAGPLGSPLVRRQHFPDGLLGQAVGPRPSWRSWRSPLRAILYDGLSQTELFYDLFGLPGIGALHGPPAAGSWRSSPRSRCGSHAASGRPRSAPASCRSRSATSSPTT